MEHPKIIGREKEQEILRKLMSSQESEMVAVIGRRRVGKTFLVNSVFGNQIDFELTGIQNATLQRQLKNFTYQLSESSGEKQEKPEDWFDAFVALIQFLKTREDTKKKVIFLDELPWLATSRSGFLEGLSFFWNSWASKQNVVLIICGSAASWMIQKVVNDKGGLHNRITKIIQLQPFSLAETEAYFKGKNINLDRYQIIQIYMAMGGIPHYLKEIEGGKSAIQNINRICFSPNGLLSKEFSRLYSALFKNADSHISIIRVLAATRQGLNRTELIKATQLSDGGGVKRILEELKHSGFIAAYYPFGKKKNGLIYRLTDEYSLFYLKFIENKNTLETDIWQELSQTQTYRSWTGYAFEGICLKHIVQIKKALSIAGVYSESSSFYKKGDKEIKGIQIDLLINRNDHVINLFEIKFYNGPFIPTKDFAMNLRTKMTIFKSITKTPKQIFINFISPFPLIENENSIGLIEQTLTLDDLFQV